MAISRNTTRSTFSRFLLHLIKYTALILTLALIVSILVAPNSASNYDDALAVIDRYAPDESTNFSIKSVRILKSLSNGNDTYTLYELEPYGYAVLLNETNSLMEADYSPSASSPIDNHSTATYFYGGAHVLLRKSR